MTFEEWWEQMYSPLEYTMVKWMAVVAWNAALEAAHEHNGIDLTTLKAE